MPKSIIDTGKGDLITVEHLEMIVRAHEAGRRPAWGPDGHDKSWWIYQLARHVLAANGRPSGSGQS